MSDSETPATSKRLEIIEKTIAAGSKDPFHFYARAMELRSLGRKDDALTAFGELRDRTAAYVPTYLMAAQVAHELGKSDEARTWAQAGVEAAKKAGDDHALSELGTFLGSL